MWCEFDGPDLCDHPTVNQCWGHGTCVYTNSTSNGYTCLCDEGWALFDWCRYPNGPDLCAFDPGPCDPSATCMPLPNSTYHCECPPGRTGVNCTVPFDVCNSNPCQNGGTCDHIVVGHYFTCICPPDYHGDMCHIRSHTTQQTGLTCTPQCHNGTGKCVADHGILSCHCVGNWSGADCSTFICGDNPCYGDSVCIEHPADTSQYQCVCPTGFTGTRCDLIVNRAADETGVGSDTTGNHNLDTHQQTKWHLIIAFILGGLLLCLLLSVVVMVILVKRKRVSAKIWWPQTVAGDRSSPAPEHRPSPSQPRAVVGAEVTSDRRYTPLMLVVTRKPVTDNSKSIDTLIAAGVKLDATNDFLQTALHLAAASSRGDYVKQLLGSGANPNLQDNWGNTVLHTAIGAGAEGAFMILLHHPKTNINAKCDGGFTPLMLAVKQVNQRMVKQLFNKNADITATDTEGRTALHWAAKLNNLESLKLLIRQGPDLLKDQQDNEGQTPLFLACREGAVPCIKHLLLCFANALLLDDLDRLPMQIAYEKEHLDVVNILKMSTLGPFTYQLHPHAHFQRPPSLQMAVYNPAMDQEASLMQPPPRSLTVPNLALKARKQPLLEHSAGMTYPATSAHGMNHDQAFQMGGGDMQGSRQCQKLMRSFFPSHSQGQTFATPELTTPNNFQLDALQTMAGYAPYSQSLQPPSTPHDLQTSPNMKPLTSAYMNGMISNDNTSYMYSDELLRRHQVPVTSYHMSALPTTSVYADLDLDRYAHADQAPLNPPTSCYEQEDPAVSLSDIEPTVRQLGDLSSVSQSSAGNVSVTQNINYITQNIDDLPAVGYGLTPTSTIVDTTQSKGFIIPQSSAGHDLVSSSYWRTVYEDCQSCPQSIVSSSSLQTSPNMKPLTSAYMNGMISNDNTATFSSPLPMTSSYMYSDELLRCHQVPVTSYHMSALPTTSVYADLDLDRYAHADQAPLNPPTSCYEQEAPTVSLSDIEPTVRQLGDLSSVSQSSAGNVSVTQNINYITQNIDDLPAVDYGLTPAGHDVVSSTTRPLQISLSDIEMIVSELDDLH